jgi:hypothetical protein
VLINHYNFKITKSGKEKKKKKKHHPPTHYRRPPTNTLNNKDDDDHTTTTTNSTMDCFLSNYSSKFEFCNLGFAVKSVFLNWVFLFIGVL